MNSIQLAIQVRIYSESPGPRGSVPPLIRCPSPDFPLCPPPPPPAFSLGLHHTRHFPPWGSSPSCALYLPFPFSRCLVFTHSLSSFKPAQIQLLSKNYQACPTPEPMQSAPHWAQEALSPSYSAYPLLVYYTVTLFIRFGFLFLLSFFPFSW